ncbi:monoglyceride lipase-like isoform X2 [Clavelina lepadiformis]|uniref:monoglyceride lipase-like isoform X2 n=1 Tax=Clavelina lepadiformis TaxID=159417 RepID=UPI004041307D
MLQRKSFPKLQVMFIFRIQMAQLTVHVLVKHLSKYQSTTRQGWRQQPRLSSVSCSYASTFTSITTPTGAGLSILFAHQNPGLFKCVALSAPLIESCQKTSSVQLMAMRYLSSWFPNLGVGVIDPNTISRDKEQVENYKTDPLIYHGKVLLCTAYQMHRMMEDIKKVLPEISYPFLLIHGTSDGLCEFSASEEMHVKAKSSDKTFKIYQEGYHELIHEINDVPEQFLADVKEWFEKRLL